MDNRKFMFRKQYVLGPGFVDIFPESRKITIEDGCYLTAHPDLEITQARSGNNYLYLLGYILDPYNPAYSNSDIVERVLAAVRSPDDLFRELAGKCGRYVAIARFHDEYRIFSDTAGMRQVFFHQDTRGHLWCASQPHIIAEHLHLSVDSAIRADLGKTALFSSDSNYWYPGAVTLYASIRHLLPNHFLDLLDKTVLRYWPSEKLIPVSYNECVQRAGRVLEGIIESACNRFSDLAFAISSGLDSRMLLAASRKCSDRITYFTHVENNSGRTGTKDGVPGELCEKLGLKHDYVSHAEADKEFERVYKINVFTARHNTMLYGHSIYKHFDLEEKNLAVIYGNCAEICKRDRCRYPEVPDFLITGESINEMALLSSSRIAFNEFEGWLAGIKEPAGRCNVNVLDLLHWEHRVGSWASMTFHEYEMAFETICPYSCRHYIELLLSVPFKHRTKPHYRLHHDIALNLWPETLELPVNPENNNMKKWILYVLYKTGSYDILRYLYLMHYRRPKFLRPHHLSNSNSHLH